MTPLFPCILKRLIPTALVVDVPHASVQPRHRWARPGHLHRMVADWDCIVRNLVRVADGRVKPGHDGGQVEEDPLPLPPPAGEGGEISTLLHCCISTFLDFYTPEF